MLRTLNMLWEMFFRPLTIRRQENKTLRPEKNCHLTESVISSNISTGVLYAKPSPRMGSKSNFIIQLNSADVQVFSDEALISLSSEGQGVENLWVTLSTLPKSQLSECL